MSKILGPKGLEGTLESVKWPFKGIRKRRMKMFVKGAPVLQEKQGVNPEPAPQGSTVSAGHGSCMLPMQNHTSGSVMERRKRVLWGTGLGS